MDESRRADHRLRPRDRAHRLGGAVGLGVLITSFDAAGAGSTAANSWLTVCRHRSRPPACLLIVALFEAVIALPHPRPESTASPARLAAEALRDRAA